MKVLEHTNDETVGVFETDTLTLAMGLLTAVLSQPHKVGYIHNTGHLINCGQRLHLQTMHVLKRFVLNC